MSATTDLIQKIYIAYFNRPADVAGLKYWATQLETKQISVADLAQSFSEQVEFKQVYAGKDSRAVVSSLYSNLFGRDPDSAGLQYWVEQLTAKTVRLGTVALAILQGAKPESDDAKIIANKLRYADEFTLNLASREREAEYKTSADFNAAKLILAKVGKDFYTRADTGNADTVSQMSLLNSAPTGETGAGGLTQEIQLELDLSKAKVGDTLELFKGDQAFPGRVFKTLTLQDLAQSSIKLSIPTASLWDDNAVKTLIVRSIDRTGAVIKVEHQLDIEAQASHLTMPRSDEFYSAWLQNADGTIERYYSKIKFVLQAGQIKNGIAVLRNGDQILAKTEIATQDFVEFKFDTVLGKQVYKLFASAGLSLTLQDNAGGSVSGNISSSGITHQFSYVLPSPAKNIQLQLQGNKDGGSLVNADTTNLIVTAEIDGLQAFSGSAILYLNGVAIARDNQILVNDKVVSFDLKTANNKDLLAIIKAGGVLSVTLKDSLNNLVPSQETLNLQVDKSLGGSGTVVLAGNALSNLQFSALGGDKQANTLNSSNTGLRVSADIKSGVLNPVYAYLSLDGRVIASDNTILSSDKQVSFELNYASNAELQNAIAKGGSLKANLVTADGKVWSSSDEILLAVTYSTPVTAKLTAPTEIIFFDSATQQAITNWDKTKDSITVQAKIVAGQASNGYAVLKLGGVQIAQDKLISASDTSVSFKLNSNDYELRKLLADNNLKFGIVSITLYDSQGNAATSQQNPVLSIALSDLNDAYYTPFMMGLSFLDVGVVQKILEPDTPGYIYPTSFAKEVHLQTASLPATIGRAELYIGERKIATDSQISASDKTIDFSFTPEFEGFLAYTGFSVKLYDQQGGLLEQTPNLLGVWLRSGTHRTDLNPVASSSISFNATGGVVHAGQFNASNTGAVVKALIPAIAEAGMRAELHLITEEFSDASNRAIASLSNLQLGSSEVSFNLSNSGAHAFANELTPGAKFEVWLISAQGEIAKTVRSEPLQADYRIPDLPHQAWLLDGASAKELRIAITAGQLNNGKASLNLNGQQIASDDVIGQNDSTISFKLDPQYNATILTSIQEGKLSVTLSDAFSNSTSLNLTSLNVATSLANNADLIAPGLAASNAYTHTRAADNAYGIGDTLVLRFSEATTKQLAMSDFLSMDQFGRIKTANFGQGASLSWNGSGTECSITLGNLADFELLNDVGKLIVVGVTDLAGNKAELVFTP